MPRCQRRQFLAQSERPRCSARVRCEVIAIPPGSNRIPPGTAVAGDDAARNMPSSTWLLKNRTLRPLAIGFIECALCREGARHTRPRDRIVLGPHAEIVRSQLAHRKLSFWLMAAESASRRVFRCSGQSGSVTGRAQAWAAPGVSRWNTPAGIRTTPWYPQSRPRTRRPAARHSSGRPRGNDSWKTVPLTLSFKGAGQTKNRDLGEGRVK
jgi:hypothetical protein